MSVTLAERLRSETRAQHVELERSALMQQLLRGRMPQPTYCALLRNLHPIYQALEAGLAACASHPGVAPVCSPELWREPALRADPRCARTWTCCTGPTGRATSRCNRLPQRTHGVWLHSLTGNPSGWWRTPMYAISVT